MRSEVVGAQPEAAVRVAHGVGEAGAAGHDEQRMALAQFAERGAQRLQRVRADPAADLDDGQHRRFASSAASAAAGPEVGESATARPRRAATSRPRNAPEPTATTGASAGCTRRAASSIWRSCSAWRNAAIASISLASSCSRSEQTSRAIRSRANATVAGRPSGVGQS